MARYQFQMGMIALAGLILPGAILGICIAEPYIREKFEKMPLILSIVITTLAALLLLMSIFLILYTVDQSSSSYMGYYGAIIACIIIADGLLALCLISGIRNLLDNLKNE